MATEIKVWQIINGKLEPIEVSMTEAGRKEVQDLEKWIKSKPDILGEDILIIGEQTPTKSGPLDFLGIDKSGNILIIELKRDKIPREALAQAIDYASDIATWDLDKLSEACYTYLEQPLEDYITTEDKFEDINIEDLSINQSQRILLVGTFIEESLQRMIEWLSENYGVSINAIILKYIKTRKGEELIAKTSIIPEEIEIERSKKQQRKIIMSDEPGTYEGEQLEELIKKYLSENRPTPHRIKTIILPLCLSKGVATREMIKKELVNRNEAYDEGKAGTILTTISKELGIKRRDYLRQIIRYDRGPAQEKENYRIDDKYKDLVKRVLDYLESN